MRKLSCIAMAAAGLVLVTLPAAPVQAENAPNTSAAPSAVTTPAPAPAASHTVTTTTPAATTPAATAEPTKGSKKKKATRMTGHHSMPKPYEHFVGFDKMF